MILDLRKCLDHPWKHTLCVAAGLSMFVGCYSRAESQGSQWNFLLAVPHGVCWDVRSQDIYNGRAGATIQQMNCNGGDTQAFYITKPTETPVRGLRQILTAFARYSRVFGFPRIVPTAMSAVNGGPNSFSQWTLEPGPMDNVAYIVNPITRLYVDRVTGTLSPGLPLQIRPFNGGPTQQWVLQPVTDPKLLSKLKTRNTK
jgi:hypothetical protein